MSDVSIGGKLCKGRYGQANSGGVVGINGVLDSVLEIPQSTSFSTLDHLLALVPECGCCADGLALLLGTFKSHALAVPVDTGAWRKEHGIIISQYRLSLRIVAADGHTDTDTP